MPLGREGGSPPGSARRPRSPEGRRPRSPEGRRPKSPESRRPSSRDGVTRRPKSREALTVQIPGRSGGRSRPGTPGRGVGSPRGGRDTPGSGRPGSSGQARDNTPPWRRTPARDRAEVSRVSKMDEQNEQEALQQKLSEVRETLHGESFASRRASSLNVRKTFDNVQISAELDAQDVSSLTKTKRMLLNRLKNVRLFQQLPISQCLYLIKHGHKEILREGDKLFEQGDQGTAFYTILKGAVAVYKADHDDEVDDEDTKKIMWHGRPVKPHSAFGPCVNIMVEGQHFGEMALATEANKRHATVVGLDCETELFMIDRTVYNRVLRRNINIFHMAENYVALLNTPSDLRSPSDIQILVQMTQQHSVFHQLPLHVMEKLCKSMFLQKHQKSSVIYCQGVPVGMESCFYIVLSGTVSVHTKPGGVRPEDRVSSDKRMKTADRRNSLLTNLSYDDLEARYGKCINTLHPGSSFGEMAFLSNAPRESTIVCRQDVKLLVISKLHFQSAMQEVDYDKKLLFLPEKIMQLLQKTGVDRTDEDLDSIVAMTRHIKFFGSMDTSQHRDICKVMQCIKLAADEVIVQQGDPGDAFYILLTGHVSIHHIGTSALEEHLQAGEERRDRLTVEEFYGPSVKLLGKGDSFGEMALLKSEPRNATVVTLETTDLIVLGKADYERTMKSHAAEKLNQKLQTLERIPLLRTLTKIDKTRLTYFLQEKVFPMGARPVMQGFPASGLYFILEGAGKVMMKHPTRRRQEVELSTLPAGELFGAVACIKETEEPCTVQIVAATRALFLPVTEIFSAFPDNTFLDRLQESVEQQLEWQTLRMETVLNTRAHLSGTLGNLGYAPHMNRRTSTPTKQDVLPSEESRIRMMTAAGRTMVPIKPKNPFLESSRPRTATSARKSAQTPYNEAFSESISGTISRPSTANSTFAPVTRNRMSSTAPANIGTPRWGPMRGATSASGLRRPATAMGARDEPKPRTTRVGRSKVNTRDRLMCDVDIRGAGGRARSAGYVRLVCGSGNDLEGRAVSSLTNCNYFTKSRQINDFTRQFVSKLRNSEGSTAS